MLACRATSTAVPSSYTAEWMAARLAGTPFASERWFVEPTGRVAKTPLA